MLISDRADRIVPLRGKIAALLLLAFALPCAAAESYRLRLENRAGGPAQVSLDRGGRWIAIGRVTRRLAKLAPGPGAPGKVVAVSATGIRIGLTPAGSGSAGFRILSAARRPARGWPADSLVVDIPAGSGFWGPLAPPPGSPVLLEDRSGRTSAPAAAFRPTGGERFVIPVEAAPETPTGLTFENWTGGKVRASYSDGREAEVGTVRFPLTGAGAVPHPGVAAPGRVVALTLGGIAVSARSRGGVGLELTAPQSARSSWQLQADLSPIVWRAVPLGAMMTVKIDNGAWEPLPEVGAAAPQAFTAAGLREAFVRRGVARPVSSGVTHLRLAWPKRDVTALLARAAAASAPAPRTAPGAVRGVLAIDARLKNAPNIRYVTFSVDGRLRAMIDTEPFEFLWDTTEVEDGRHVIEVKGLDKDGSALATTRKAVIVANGPRPPPAGAGESPRE
ncbi:MAG: hypothetical protein IT210_19920 [Armatimonadetes bacterium]|nr:hypothetical protein [Armatimonadota bacterium]